MCVCGGGRIGGPTQVHGFESTLVLLANRVRLELLGPPDQKNTIKQAKGDSVEY